ncbi:MAG: hypothetical protein AAF481_10630 [Acidobacteriota bacterium]
MLELRRNPPIAALFALALSLAWTLGTIATEIVEIPGAEGRTIELEVDVPPDFDPDVAYPVLVGAGDYYWQDHPSQPGWIIVLSAAFWSPDRLEDAPRVLAWIRENYRVRGGGCHSTGWSRNSAGIFEIAMAYPEQFLSVTGVAGMPGRGSEKDLEKLRDVRVQFIVGENDTYWKNGSEDWHQKLKALGVDSTLEIIPDGAHVMPELINKPFFERMNRLVAKIEAAQ